MFCQKCGAEMPDGALFCSKCGTPVNGTVQSNAPSYENGERRTREETLDTINKMIEYFSEKNYLYRKIDQVNCKYVKVSKSSFYWKRLSCIALFGTIILTIILLAFGQDVSECIAGAFLISMSLGLIVPLIIKIALKSKLKKRQAALANEITEYYNQLSYCPIGVEYSDPEILAELESLIKSGRADTLKEAINTMVDDIHKNNMEAAAFMSAQSAYMAAKSARVAAVTGAVNLFKK